MRGVKNPEKKPRRKKNRKRNEQIQKINQEEKGKEKEFKNMCYQVKCNKCSKITWAGCGMHIESALAGVPEENLCKCATPQKGGRCTAQ